MTEWDAQNLSTTYTRTGAAPFTIGQSRLANLFGHQAQFSDTLTWSKARHNLRVGTTIAHHNSGGTGSEPGTAVLGTFTFLNTTTAPFVSGYSVPTVIKYDATKAKAPDLALATQRTPKGISILRWGLP